MSSHGDNKNAENFPKIENQSNLSHESDEYFDINNDESNHKINNSSHVINSIQKNSFMLLKENSQILEPLSANKSSFNNNALNQDENGLRYMQNSQIWKNQEEDYYICHVCLKTFPLKINYEMHVNYCVKEYNPDGWENFGNNTNNNINNNNFINDYHEDIIDSELHNNPHEINIDNEDTFLYINASEANDYPNIINNNFIHDHNSSASNSHNSYHSHSLSAANSDDQDDLDYEHLLQLDANVKHPLDKQYYSMFISENIKQNTIDHLAEDSKKCIICFEDFEANQKIIRLPCFHIFHEDEIYNWFNENKTCPTCRVDIEELLFKY